MIGWPRANIFSRVVFQAALPIVGSAARRERACWMLALLLLVGRAGAQSVPETTDLPALKEMSVDQLMNVEVTSVSLFPEKLSQAASAIQVLSNDDIRRSGATTLPEALRLADNLEVAQKNSHDWAISARGFNTELANKLLVMIDGRSVYTPLFSGVYWNVQDYLLADVDRIEVVSGPGGTLWGANAVNGVINVTTKSARDTQGWYLEGGGGAPASDFAAVRYGGTLAPNVYFRVYGKFADVGQETLADGSGGADSWTSRQGGFRLDDLRSPADTLTLQGDAYHDRDGLQTGGSSVSSGDNLLGRWVHTLPDQAEVRLQLYYDHTHFLDPIPALSLPGIVAAPAGILTDDLDTYDLEFQHRFWPGRYHHVVWGFGYRQTDDRNVNAPALAFFPADRSLNLYSGFVQDEAELRDDLFLTLGSKVEHNDYTGFETEPNARLRWNLTPANMIWTAVSRAVRTPSRVDRDLSEPTPPYRVVLRGSDQFAAETVVAYELGYRTQLGDRVALALSTFDNDYGNVRSTSITPGTILPFYFANNLEGETHGLEFSGDWQVAANWRLHAGYDLLREHLHVKPGQFDLNAALNETADPRQQWSVRSAVDLPGGIEWDAAFRWVDSLVTNSGPTPEIVPGYYELDTRVGWHPVPQLELALVGQNLLHREHAEFGAPGPTSVDIGRTVYGKATWSY